MRDAGLVVDHSTPPTTSLADGHSGSEWHGEHHWAGLLHRFYRRAALEAPHYGRLRGSEMPEPYRSLLVHSRDMTPTLERFHGRPLSITVLSREREDDSYYREVTLNVEASRPVEYGAIRIYLQHFPAGTRARVLQEQLPLGKILELDQIAHVGWPQAFFRTGADNRMCALLHMPQPADLYGRRNVLLDGDRRLLAEVIEILAPIDK